MEIRRRKKNFGNHSPYYAISTAVVLIVLVILMCSGQTSGNHLSQGRRRTNSGGGSRGRPSRQLNVFQSARFRGGGGREGERGGGERGGRVGGGERGGGGRGGGGGGATENRRGGRQMSQNCSSNQPCERTQSRSSSRSSGRSERRRPPTSNNRQSRTRPVSRNSNRPSSRRNSRTRPVSRSRTRSSTSPSTRRRPSVRPVRNDKADRRMRNRGRNSASNSGGNDMRSDINRFLNGIKSSLPSNLGIGLGMSLPSSMMGNNRRTSSSSSSSSSSSQRAKDDRRNTFDSRSDRTDRKRTSSGRVPDDLRFSDRFSDVLPLSRSVQVQQPVLITDNEPPANNLPNDRRMVFEDPLTGNSLMAITTPPSTNAFVPDFDSLIPDLDVKTAAQALFVEPPHNTFLASENTGVSQALALPTDNQLSSDTNQGPNGQISSSSSANQFISDQNPQFNQQGNMASTAGQNFNLNQQGSMGGSLSQNFNSNQQGNMGSSSSQNFNSNQQGNMGSSSNQNFNSNQQGNIGGSSSQNFNSNQQGNMAASLNQNFNSNQQGNMGSSSSQNFNSNQQGNMGGSLNQNFNSNQQGNMGSFSNQNFNSNPQSNMGSSSNQNFILNQQGTMETNVNSIQGDINNNQAVFGQNQNVQNQMTSNQNFNLGSAVGQIQSSMINSQGQNVQTMNQGILGSGSIQGQGQNSGMSQMNNFVNNDQLIGNGQGQISFNNNQMQSQGHISVNNNQMQGQGQISFNSNQMQGQGQTPLNNNQMQSQGQISFNNNQIQSQGQNSLNNNLMQGQGQTSLNNNQMQGQGQMSLNNNQMQGQGQSSFNQFNNINNQMQVAGTNLGNSNFMQVQGQGLNMQGQMVIPNQMNNMQNQGQNIGTIRPNFMGKNPNNFISNQGQIQGQIQGNMMFQNNMQGQIVNNQNQMPVNNVGMNQMLPMTNQGGMQQMNQGINTVVQNQGALSLLGGMNLNQGGNLLTQVQNGAQSNVNDAGNNLGQVLGVNQGFMNTAIMANQQQSNVLGLANNLQGQNNVLSPTGQTNMQNPMQNAANSPNLPMGLSQFSNAGINMQSPGTQMQGANGAMMINNQAQINDQSTNIQNSNAVNNNNNMINPSPQPTQSNSFNTGSANVDGWFPIEPNTNQFVDQSRKFDALNPLSSQSNTGNHIHALNVSGMSTTATPSTNKTSKTLMIQIDPKSKGVKIVPDGKGGVKVISLRSAVTISPFDSGKPSSERVSFMMKNPINLALNMSDNFNSNNNSSDFGSSLFNDGTTIAPRPENQMQNKAAMRLGTTPSLETLNGLGPNDRINTTDVPEEYEFPNGSSPDVWPTDKKHRKLNRNSAAVTQKPNTASGEITVTPPTTTNNEEAAGGFGEEEFEFMNAVDLTYLESLLMSENHQHQSKGFNNEETTQLIHQLTKVHEASSAEVGSVTDIVRSILKNQYNGNTNSDQSMERTTLSQYHNLPKTTHYATAGDFNALITKLNEILHAVKPYRSVQQEIVTAAINIEPVVKPNIIHRDTMATQINMDQSNHNNLDYSHMSAIDIIKAIARLVNLTSGEHGLSGSTTVEPIINGNHNVEASSNNTHAHSANLTSDRVSVALSVGKQNATHMDPERISRDFLSYPSTTESVTQEFRFPNVLTTTMGPLTAIATDPAFYSMPFEGHYHSDSKFTNRKPNKGSGKPLEHDVMELFHKALGSNPDILLKSLKKS